MIRPLHIRWLLIVAFMLSVAGNSLAAVSPFEGDGECGGCCSAPRRNQPRVSQSRPCCLTECGQTGETQRSEPTSLLRTKRDNKGSSPVVLGVAAAYSIQPSGFLHSPARSIVQSTHIYLRTGTLLI
ncbi:MAG: hypothetical protein AABO57_27825 [Acidobacteriota bacterium]